MSEGRCARHPDAVAHETCERCGDYYCRGCADAQHPGVCAGCASRLPHGIAWEDTRAGVLPWRFVLTIRDVLIRPRIAFPGPARPLPALGFAAICGALVSVLLVLYGVTLVALDDALLRPMVQLDGPALALASVVGSLACVALTVGLAIAQSVSFAIGLRIAGRSRGLLRFGARASGYAQGLLLLAIVIPWGFALALSADPQSALLAELRQLAWLAVSFAWPIMSGRVWFEAARGLGLGSGRAAIAAGGPLLLCTLPAAYISHLQLTG